MKSIKPLSDRVVVEIKKKEENNRSGIIIPDSISKNAKIGNVVEVGPGRRTDDGKEIPMSVKKGDMVVFSWGEEVDIDGSEYHIINESSVLAVLE